MRENNHPLETFLLFRDGNLMGLGFCDTGTQLIDRAHCQRDIHFAPSAMVQDRLFARFGQNMDKLQLEASEHQIAIERADFRLLELLKAVPDPVNPQLKPLMEAKAAEVRATDAEIAGVDDQIARITAELARSEDPELRKQLLEQQSSRGSLLQKRNAFNRELNSLRNQYTTANSGLIDPVTWDVVQGQKSHHINAIDRVEKDLNTEIERRIAASRALNFVADQSFVYEFLNRTGSELFSAIRALYAVFMEARETYSVFPAVPVAHRMSFDIEVNRPGPLESFNCELSWSPGGVCNKIRVSNAERRLEVEIPSTKFQVNEDLIQVPELGRLLGTNVQGRWRIAAYCTQSIVTIVTNNCKMILE